MGVDKRVKQTRDLSLLDASILALNRKYEVVVVHHIVIFIFYLNHRLI